MAQEERERTDRIHETIDVLIHAMRMHHRIVEKRIDGLGVHHSQHRMLMKLSFLGKSASQKDIAEALDVSPACVARTLKHLSASGLIERAEGADGRCKEISILPEGRKLVDDSIEVFRQIGDEMFEGVSPRELETVNDVLRRIQQNLVEMERGDAGPVDAERSL